MNKNRFSAILLLILVTVSLQGCTYDPQKTRIWIDAVSRKPNTYDFVVAFIYEKYQDPNGFINTFPNGGSRKILEQSITFYLCNADTKKAKFLREIKAPLLGIKLFKSDNAVSFGKWEEEEFYFALDYFGNHHPEPKKYFFKMNQNGEYRRLSLNKLPQGEGVSIARMQGENIYMRLWTETEPPIIKILTQDDGEYVPIFAIDKEKRTIVPIEEN